MRRPRKLGIRVGQLVFNHVLSLRNQHNLKNAVFCENRKHSCLTCSSHIHTHTPFVVGSYETISIAFGMGCRSTNL